MIVVTAFITFVLACWFLPWWGLGLVAFVLGLFPLKLKLDWKVVSLLGAVAVLLVTYGKDRRLDFVISNKMAGFLFLPSVQVFYLFLTVLGAVSVALWFLAGQRLIKVFPKPRSARD